MDTPLTVITKQVDDIPRLLAQLQWMIDIQRDSIEPGSFGDALGNDVGAIAGMVEPIR